MSNIPFTITDRTCTVYVEGKPYTVDRSTLTFKKLVELLNNPNLRIMPKTQTTMVKEVLENYGAELKAKEQALKDKVVVTRRNVLYNGEPVAEELERRILDIASEGLPIDGWVRFVENLMQNPAAYARDELYQWLEGADLPITEDGCFLAYKRVTDTYHDIHSGTYDNSPGRVVELREGRPGVDPIRSRTCSTGLHFCSKEYLPHFGGWGGEKVVLVKINPADVVSIPDDYDNTKGRTWRYEVVADVSDDFEGLVWAPLVNKVGNPFDLDPQGNPVPYSEDQGHDFVDDDWEDEWDEYYGSPV